MIARSWTGRVPHQYADGFARHLLATGVAETASLPGNLGAQVLRRDLGEHIEFRFVSYWDSWEAIRRFAGEDINKAVLYPGDEQYGLIPAPEVEHHHVVSGGLTE
jgi:heme-degrading monooxygenase HmoA